MRSMRYTIYTRCLRYPGEEGTYVDGSRLTLGSRDKYIFVPSHTDYHAELYIFRFSDGRTTKPDNREYEIRCFPLGDCGNSADVYLETGDILLGVSSSATASDGGAGCSPVLYVLRPMVTRNPSVVLMPPSTRGCQGED
jgi:hypothetical protein